MKTMKKWKLIFISLNPSNHTHHLELTNADEYKIQFHWNLTMEAEDDTSFKKAHNNQPNKKSRSVVLNVSVILGFLV